MTPTRARSLRFLFAATAVLAVGTTACSKGEAPQQPVVQKVAPKEKAKAPESPKGAETAAAKPGAAVFYNPAGKRDPFVPFLRPEPKTVRTGQEGIPPLQRYELGELRFVGVIWGPKGNYALIEDAEGRGYTVVVGTRIGRGGGVVTRISQREIFVKEEFSDYAGAKVVRESSMKLHTAGGK
jgi:Tfp pilus assembly protein PilP